MYLVYGVNFLFLFNFPPKSKRRQNEFFPSFIFHFGSRFSLSTQLELNLVDFNHPEAIRDIYKVDIPIFYSKCLQLVQDSRLELQFLVEKDMSLSSPSFQNSLSQGSRYRRRWTLVWISLLTCAFYVDVITVMASEGNGERVRPTTDANSRVCLECWIGGGMDACGIWCMLNWT
ncbi:uncharacterized protein LOC132636418 [Lycium barbarum]|uniref:uncharacterized protein LOC132636418 n=1 Tax=Lycium barbarum TaxID=112863 RepID=UPI00293EBF9B|nr:uncharacterized protein LOC132636418 [Lycium barbarum]